MHWALKELIVKARKQKLDTRFSAGSARGNWGTRGLCPLGLNMMTPPPVWVAPA
ncbi:unnamed protein product [marine sediment metagenome]|uniref:Uncharacterized protein n=1 Tax=marine sediment metagenome TaxID=412755 RepID=X1MB58_9ZZZZ